MIKIRPIVFIMDRHGPFRRYRLGNSRPNAPCLQGIQPEHLRGRQAARRRRPSYRQSQRFLSLNTAENRFRQIPDDFKLTRSGFCRKVLHRADQPDAAEESPVRTEIKDMAQCA